MNKKALHALSYGIYVVTTIENERLNGFIGNSVFQITSEPPRMAVSCNKDNFTHDLIKKSGVIGVSILGQKADREIIQLFGYKSGRDTDKFKKCRYTKGSITGVPLLSDDALALFELNVEQEISIGTHTLFICEVLACEMGIIDDEMTYKYYHEVMHGKAPKNAPTYIEESKSEERDTMNKDKKYVCTLCGYEYNPELGDPDHGIAPGTAWEDIPEDWTCPVCGVGKEMFEQVY